MEIINLLIKGRNDKYIMIQSTPLCTYGLGNYSLLPHNTHKVSTKANVTTLGNPTEI